MQKGTLITHKQISVSKNRGLYISVTTSSVFVVALSITEGINRLYLSKLPSDIKNQHLIIF